MLQFVRVLCSVQDVCEQKSFTQMQQTALSVIAPKLCGKIVLVEIWLGLACCRRIENPCTHIVDIKKCSHCVHVSQLRCPPTNKCLGQYVCPRSAPVLHWGGKTASASKNRAWRRAASHTSSILIRYQLCKAIVRASYSCCPHIAVLA